ncbi:MAG: NAD-dependent epimerase/dehydratase family protein [Candidatus Obscuribacterales bacterium]|nr:NAD-dependent epimerase/dehydratase family protein [Candidatus Obscuribacterales bacterium]
MDILVTGASGFIGSRLAEKLIDCGHTVSTCGRQYTAGSRLYSLGAKHHQGDICNPEFVNKITAGKDAVFHLAGLVSYRRADYDKLFTTNVIGTKTVMQGCLQNGVGRVIHMGSIAGMGIPNEGEIGTEEIKYNLQGHGLYYCDTKYAGEQEVMKYAAQGLSVLALNPGITFGDGDTHPHHHTIFRAMSSGWLLGYPAGGVMFSDLEDVVDTCIKALDHGRSGQRYVLGSANMTFKNAADELATVLGGRKPQLAIPGWLSEGAGILCESICSTLKRKSPLTWQVAWLSQRKIFFSSQKAIEELGHKQTSFSDTLRRVAPFYLNQ